MLTPFLYAFCGALGLIIFLGLVPVAISTGLRDRAQLKEIGDVFLDKFSRVIDAIAERIRGKNKPPPSSSPSEKDKSQSGDEELGK